MRAASRDGFGNSSSWRGDSDKFGANEMAQVCDICGKKPQFGNNISHAHNVTKRR